MNVTIDQAVDIYARASRSWYGLRARQKTRERIKQFVIAGDAEGQKVFERVEHRILELERVHAAETIAH